MDGEEGKDERREETGKMFWRARHPDESRRGGGKEGTKIISDGKHRILKIGTEYRVNHSLCSGLELHHPVMSKLWNLGGQTSRQDMPWNNLLIIRVGIFPLF